MLMFGSAFFTSCNSVSFAFEREELSFSGSSEIPFPSFFPLDYKIARARAWLDALAKAEKSVPASAILRLWDLDCDTEDGKLAFSALLFPISTVTPDISSSRDIQVFISQPAELERRAAQILEAPERFFLQLALIMDMRNTLAELEKNRPQSVAEMERLSATLDPMLATLDQVWLASRELETGMDAHEALEKVIDIPGQSLPALLLLCEKKIEARENHAALALVEEGLTRLDDAANDRMPGIVKSYFLGRALHLRGLIHWRQDQLALAESDLARAIKELRETGTFPAKRASILIDLGKLRKSRQDVSGMCAAFREACVFGQCGELATLRRQDLCKDE